MHNSSASLYEGKEKGLDKFQCNWKRCAVSSTQEQNLQPVQLLAESLISGFHLISQKKSTTSRWEVQRPQSPHCRASRQSHQHRKAGGAPALNLGWRHFACWLQRCKKWRVFCQLGLQLPVFSPETLCLGATEGWLDL